MGKTSKLFRNASERKKPFRPDLEWDQDQEFLDLDGKKIEKRQKDHTTHLE